MIKVLRSLIFVFIVAVSLAPVDAQAQTHDGWKVAVYPVLAWIPTGIAIDTNLPPRDNGPGGSGPEFGGKIVDGRFDGAFMGGLSADNGRFRIDLDGLWAAVGGDRAERPVLKVDVDVFYAHASGGFAVVPDFYITAGVRGMALKYDIKLGEREFSREPGLWDPLVGIGWHHAANKKLDLHAVFEGGGFGVGADTDIGASFRLDWKPTTHFGLTGGYSLMYLKFKNTVASRTLIVTQTLQGPVVGLGLYF